MLSQNSGLLIILPYRKLSGQKDAWGCLRAGRLVDKLQCDCKLIAVMEGWRFIACTFV